MTTEWKVQKYYLKNCNTITMLLLTEQMPAQEVSVGHGSPEEAEKLMFLHQSRYNVQIPPPTNLWISLTLWPSSDRPDRANLSSWIVLSVTEFSTRLTQWMCVRKGSKLQTWSIELKTMAVLSLWTQKDKGTKALRATLPSWHQFFFYPKWSCLIGRVGSKKTKFWTSWPFL